MVAEMPSDSGDGPWAISFTPLPEIDDEIEDAELVQVMCVLPFTAESDTFPDVARLLLNVNNKVASGAFGLREADGLIFYKNTLVVPADNAASQSRIIENSFFLAGFMVEQFVNAIEMVVVGKGTLDDAREVRPDLAEFAD